MILICHGAFDSKSDRTCGVSVLADMIRALRVSEDVREIDVHDPLTIAPADLLDEPNFWIGYSNGADRVWGEYLKLLKADHNASATSVQAHVIFLDFVYEGIRQVFDRAPVNMPNSVKDCLCFYRTQMIGPMPPFHNLIAKEHEELFKNIPVDADHGNLPGKPQVQKGVLDRINQVFQSAGAPAPELA